jgi:LuxR family maltose regulon positive regulatory protein
LAAALLRARTVPGDDGPAGLAAARQRWADRPVPGLLCPWLAADRADALVAADQPIAALDALAGHLDAPPTVATAPAYLAAARAHLATGAYRRATGLLTAVCTGPSGVDSEVTARLLEAVAADGLGHSGAVRIAVAAALSLAAPERLVLPLRAAGAAGAALLHRHRDLVTAQPALAGRLADAGAPAGSLDEAGALPGPTAAPGEAVTPREGVVLRYLTTMLTTDDIAAELSVSRNTVKSQIRSIYRKLGVARRRDAVHRARALNLL